MLRSWNPIACPPAKRRKPHEGLAAEVELLETRTLLTGPTANDDNYSVEHGVPGYLSGSVLDNDYDPTPIEPLYVSLETQPAHGIVYGHVAGMFNYHPDTNFVGTDSFTYSINDDSGSDTATVTITVYNTPPDAVDDAYEIQHDFQLNTYAVGNGVLGNDSDPNVNDMLLNATVATQPQHGTLDDFQSDGHFTYTPDPGFVGTDSFTYTASDDIESDTATVTIKVGAYVPFDLIPADASPDDGSVEESPHCPDCTQPGGDSEGNPHPLLHFDVDLPDVPFDVHFTASLVVGGNTVISNKQYDIPAEQAGQTARMSLLFDASALETGFHDYTITLTARAADGTALTSKSVNGRVSVVNHINSEYGNRRWLPFLDRLDVAEALTGGVGLIRGDGTADFFVRETDGSYSAPLDLFTTLTRVTSGGVTEYLLESPAGWTKHFDAAGLLSKITDRNGRVLQSFTYTDADSDGLVDELASFEQADGHVATYTYVNGLLSESSNDRGATYHYYYNPDGTLARTTRGDGAPGGTPPEISYTYDPVTKLMLTKTGIRGLVTTYTYDENLRVSTIDRPQTGLETVSPSQTVGLDGFVPVDDVVSTSDVGGTSTSRVVGPLGYVTQTTDANGNVVEYVRDARGLVTEIHQTNPADPNTPLVTAFEYNGRGSVTKVTSADGTFREYTYATNGLDLLSFRDERGKLWTYTVDAAGNRLTATGPLGNTTSYTYDSRGNLLTVTTPDPDGAGPQAAATTSYDYDAQDRLIKVTNPDLTFRTIAYDPVSGQIASETNERGFTTSYIYNARGQVTSKTLPDPDGGGPQAAPVWIYAYCGCGSITSVTDPDGNVTSYNYNNVTGLLESTTSPDPDGAGPLPALVTSFQYDALGRLIAEVAPGNRATNYEYDGNGNLIKVTLPDPDGDPNTGDPAPVWEYGYDALNRRIWSEDPYNERTTYTYDSLGRLLTETDPTGYVSTYFYAPDGRPFKTGAPKLGGTLAAPGPLTEFTYDDAGRLTAVANPLGETTTYIYDAAGRLASVTSPDPDGPSNPQTAPVTTYTYDEMGRVLTETNARSKTTTFTYDAAGNRTSLTDASGNTTSWTYDNLGRTISETNELGETEFYEYDALGNLVRTTDRMDRVIQYNYDNLSRLLTETWIAADGVTVDNTISYSYDAWGRLDIVEDESSKYDYDYDNLDRVTSIDNNGNTTGVPRTVLTNTYDLVGRRTSLAAGDPGGLADFLNTYSYDAAGRMTQLTQAGQTGGRAVAEKRVDFTYDNLGRIDTIARYEDLLGTEHVATSDYGFDLAGRLITLAHAAGAMSLASYNYTYDRLGRLTQETSVDGVKNYDYDEIGQLTGVTGAATEDYSYDDTGNRTGGTVIGANNRLLDDGTYTYLYDDNGNRIRRTNKATGDYIVYRWDHRNRKTAEIYYNSSDIVQQAIYYRYDVFDNLIARLHDADGVAGFEDEEYYIYDSSPGKGGLDDIALIYDGNNNVKHRYLHGPGIDQVFSDESFIDGLLWAMTDRQGTVKDWADYDEATDTTSVYNHVEFDSFGKIKNQSNQWHKVTIGFTGRYVDPATGKQWHRGRWYDPETGTWESEDPSGFGGGDVNLGRYVGNGPTNGIDPSGLADAASWQATWSNDTYRLDIFYRYVAPGANPLVLQKGCVGVVMERLGSNGVFPQFHPGVKLFDNYKSAKAHYYSLSEHQTTSRHPMLFAIQTTAPLLPAPDGYNGNQHELHPTQIDLVGLYNYATAIPTTGEYPLVQPCWEFMNHGDITPHESPMRFYHRPTLPEYPYTFYGVSPSSTIPPVFVPLP